MDTPQENGYGYSMTHDSAVRTVVNLVPDIEKRGAEVVLTEYATREDLPPAQLEKLAQVYNTLRTVSYIDHAADDARGQTVPLVDVPTLVVGYATGLNHEKAAAGPHSFSTHDPRTVDLVAAMRREANLEKAAAQVTDQPAKVHETFKQAVSREQLQDALLTLEVDLEDEMSKLASEIFTAAPRVGDWHFQRDISEFEQEALQYQPPAAVKAAGAFMEKFAAPHRTKLLRFAYDVRVPQRAYDIGHALGQKFAELAKAASTLEVLIKMAAKASDGTTVVPHPVDSNADVRAIFDVPELQKADEAEVDAAQKSLDQVPSISTTAQPAAGSGGPPRAGGGDNNNKPTGDKRSTSDPGNKQESISLMDLLGTPVAAVAGATQAASDKAEGVITGITSKPRLNKAQISADVSVEDIKRAMAIRRLIGTDPVLKEADPKVVLEIYNSVTARNPQLAGDMAALRLILREAVSYEGLTLDSQKLLSEIRRNSEQADELSDINEKSRYTVGGAGPLSLVRSDSNKRA
jgi:hypothetical protein